MRAAVITALTGPDAVKVEEVPSPASSSDGVLIEVAYAGVSFPDVLHTRGAYQVRPELPFTPGWEVSGIVRHDAWGFKAGERVAAIPKVGGFAEVAVVDRRMAFKVPHSMSLATAAAVPLNYLTAHFALLRRASLEPDEIVLVHGAAGGLGSAACQLAAALGAHVIGVVSTEGRARYAVQAGAHDAVLAEDFLTKVRDITGGRGVDVVVDPVGGDRFTDSLRSLAPGGRLLVVGFTGGSIPAVKVNRLLLNNTSVMGVGVAEHWRDHPDSAASQWQELLPYLESGTIDPPISSVHDLEDVRLALRELESRQATGKVLLRIGGEHG